LAFVAWPAVLGGVGVAADQAWRDDPGVSLVDGRCPDLAVRADADLPRRRGVDVLQHRDELRPGLAQPIVDHGVVHRVAGEAVELVDNDVIDVAVALDVRNHFCERGRLRVLADLARST
jgi:hypothetical protein